MQPRRRARDEAHASGSGSGSASGSGAGPSSSSSWRGPPAFRDTRQYSPPASWRSGARHDAYDDGSSQQTYRAEAAPAHLRWGDDSHAPAAAPPPLNNGWRGAPPQQQQQQHWQPHGWAGQQEQGDWRAPQAAHGWGEQAAGNRWSEQGTSRWGAHSDGQHGEHGAWPQHGAGIDNPAPPSRGGRYQAPSWRGQDNQQQQQSRGFASSAPDSGRQRGPQGKRDKAWPGRGGHRSSAQQPLPLRKQPRDWYLDAVSAAPRCFPASLETPPTPLPLLVLDLNGTLVYRASASKSANPVPRPYLGSFLQWALGVQPHEEGAGDLSRAQQWETWDEACAERDAEGEQTEELPHGSEFWPSAASRAASSDGSSSPPPTTWRSHPSEPVPTSSSRFRLLLWSSAQPRNVAAMARAIFAPAQAKHLLRVWARDTLMPRRYMDAKASSTKDLEIVWAALNGDGGAAADGEEASAEEKEARAMQLEGERRLMAQHRSEVDDTSGASSSLGADADTSPAAATAAAIAAERYVRAPSPAGDEAQSWTPGRGYSSHNTLLLDDSPEKARLQPYNHLLLPEFDAKRASPMARWIAAHRASPTPEPEPEPEAPAAPAAPQEADEAKEGSALEREDAAAATAAAEEAKAKAATRRPFRSRPPPPQESQLDDVLLQLVGVLAHARRQRHVAAWVRSGGLGFFGGMAQPGMDDATPPEEEEGTEGEEDAQQTQTQLRLEHAPQKRTQRFWAQEGRLALRLAGVECAVV